MLRFNQKLGFFINKRQDFTHSQCRLWHLLISTLLFSYWHESLGVSAAQLRTLWESLLVTSGQHAWLYWLVEIGPKDMYSRGNSTSADFAKHVKGATLFGSPAWNWAKNSLFIGAESMSTGHQWKIGVSQGSPKRSKLDGDDWIVTFKAIRGERSSPESVCWRKNGSGIHWGLPELQNL